MKNTLRCLIINDQVSLTVIDTTDLVKRAIQLHNLSQDAAITLGKVLSCTAYMSAALKEQRGQVSVSLKGDGVGGSIGVSGDFSMHLRGYIDAPYAKGDERALLGKFGALTVVRDDGYSRPFVGSCAFENMSVDEAFEEYYRISEQLPTFIGSVVRFGDEGELAFAGISVLQPLPFADEEVVKNLPKGAELRSFTAKIESKGVREATREQFSIRESEAEWKEAVYQCHCSREYLAEVLTTLGEEQMRRIVQEDGEIKAHCHYCNTDYVFKEEDIDEIFPNATKKKDEA